MSFPIYFGSILIEPNRWAPGKLPTYRVSDWLDRLARDGFDGVELWANHAALADEAELMRLEQAPLPVTVFNAYAGMADDAAAEREQAAALVNRLNAPAVKFNLGNASADAPCYERNAAAWADAMPGVQRMLCECHAGTIMEDLDVAQAMFDRWGDARFQAIVHAFSEPEPALVDKLRRLGPGVVTHVHAALRAYADDTPALVERRIGLLRDAGFDGSITLEFTEGTGEPGEDQAVMYSRALRDLELIRKAMDR